MHRTLLLFYLIALIPHAQAANLASATSGPNAESVPISGAGRQVAKPSAETPPDQENCPPRPPLAQGAPSAILVELDPNTLWRPRGSEVRFTIGGSGGAVGVAKVRVCFGWASSDGEFRNSQGLVASPQVRSVSNDTGGAEYGATVPSLRRVPNSDWWPRRIFASTPYIFTGGFIVPVADMVAEVTTTSGQVVVTTIEVGITNVVLAWAVVTAAAVLLGVVLERIARFRRVRGRNLLLRVISTSDGYASLSQLQIVLWTLVVGMSAIYAMTLSGNLISISAGTLVLLGIASGAALAARLPGAARTAPKPPTPADPPSSPEWSDLLIPDRSKPEIDVTSLQMLAFTLITAAFVLIKVITDYEIPTIPANFLILMGISNGVYVGGMNLPSQPREGGATNT